MHNAQFCSHNNFFCGNLHTQLHFGSNSMNETVFESNSMRNLMKNKSKLHLNRLIADGRHVECIFRVAWGHALVVENASSTITSSSKRLKGSFTFFFFGFSCIFFSFWWLCTLSGCTPLTKHLRINTQYLKLHLCSTI